MSWLTLISPEELLASAATPDRVVLDARFELTASEAGRVAYGQGHLPGAVYVHLDQDLAGPVTTTSGRHPLPDREHLADLAGRWGIGPDTQVVIYDADSGAIAARAWWLLRWLGHANVAVLDGGFSAWRKAGGTPGTDLPQPSPNRFMPRAPLAHAMTTAEIERGLSDHSLLLVDARATARYEGRTEPLDTVAGHVPGAINHPFEQNLAADGRWLEVRELRQRWTRTLGAHAATATACMCGSGVTACHNLLAMEHAGFGGGHLYAGSWSEWIRNPQRPVSRTVA